jgi:hypothetical protein
MARPPAKLEPQIPTRVPGATLGWAAAKPIASRQSFN